MSAGLQNGYRWYNARRMGLEDLVMCHLFNIPNLLQIFYEMNCNNTCIDLFPSITQRENTVNMI